MPLSEQVEKMRACNHEFKTFSEKYQLQKCVHCGTVKKIRENFAPATIGLHHCIRCGAHDLTDNGYSFRCPNCQPIKLPNQVKMLPKMTKDIFISRAEEQVILTKNTWACLTCGRVWFLRQDAERCDHVNFKLYGYKVVRPVGKIKVEPQLEVTQ